MKTIILCGIVVLIMGAILMGFAAPGLPILVSMLIGAGLAMSGMAVAAVVVDYRERHR